jgi:signal transduction histidine kinase
VRASLTEFSGRVAVTYINEDTVPKLLVAVRSVPARSVILYIWHSEQGAGRVLAADEVASLVAQVSPVPVYGTNDAYIGLGVVGGVARRTDETAARLGEMARQILGGTPAEDIPDENARLVPIIDWRQVRRWGIDASRLPADADIRFRQLTAWESYRAYIVATVVVVAAQCLLIAALLTQRTRRRRAENTLRIREATLRISYERIRQLAGRLINAQEEARADIARDLHDDVCQELVGVSMALNGLMRSTGQTQDAPTQEALTSLQQRALGIIEGVRRLSHELHPATLRLVGLAVALRAHCVEVEKRHDVQVSFQADDDLRDLHADIALCLFRIAQEALRNSAVHGESRRITVSIVNSGDAVELSVSDDGRGFNLEAVRRGGRGLGLVSIEERAHALGGEVQIVSRPQQGTSIRVRIHVGARARSEKDDEDVPVRMLTPQLVPTSTERS